MKIDNNVIDELNQQIVLTVEKADYADKFKSQLKQHAAKASIKGFRKGKTPASVIKKMYGQQVLVEVINQQIQQGLNDHITENKLELLGQPIPAEDQDTPVFDVNTLKDYTFKFDIGMANEFDVKGVSKKYAYKQYDVQIDDEFLQKEIDNMLAQGGQQVEVEDSIEEKDIITIEAEEEGKKDGWATTFTVIVESLDDDYKAQLLKMKKGDEFTFDIAKLEKNRDQKYVDKYLLNKSDEDAEVEIGNDFKGTVTKSMRLEKAAFDQAFFDKYFGEGEVTDEAEAKDKIRENIKTYYTQQAKNIMYRDIMDKTIEKSDVQVPEVFLKRWLKLNNENVTDEQLETEFTPFVENLKWNLIKGKLAKSWEIEATQEDVLQAMQQKVQSYFGQYGLDPSMAQGVMQQMMQNQEEVNKTYEEVLAHKVFEQAGEKVKVNLEEISHDDFLNVVKELNEKQNAK